MREQKSFVRSLALLSIPMQAHHNNSGEPPRPDESALTRYLRKDWLRCLLLAVVGFAVRAPALQGQLIWDDQYLARDNPFIKSPLLALEAFRHYLFLDSYSAHYRPVQNLSYMFDYAFWNTNTFGFHLTNVLLHVLSGVLLYFLLRRLFVRLGALSGKLDPSLAALAVAAIWLVHPVHSAAVDYISGRADSLAFVFACAAWLLFFKARDCAGKGPAIVLYLLTFASALLALCSRETALIWLVLFIVYALAFERTLGRRAKYAVAIACVVVIAAYAGLRHLPGQRATASPSMGWSAPVRGILMLRALGDYTRLLVFPSNLHMERTVFSGPAFQNETGREGAVTLEYLSLLGAAALVSLVAMTLWRTPGQRMRIFGAAWFMIAFLPTSNLVDLNATVAEHWLYLPSVGFLIFLAGCAVEFRMRPAQIAVLIAATAALGVRSFYRSGDWVDPETFYERTAAAGGTSCRVSVNLGQIYAGRGDYAKAEKLFRNVLSIQPDYTIARNNLADALSHLGRDKEAEQVLAQATAGAHQSRKDYPRTWIAAMNFARLLDSKKDAAGAYNVLENARRDYPGTWELISYESELLRRDGKIEQAIALVRPFVEQNWWHYPSSMALGRLLAEQGKSDLAEAALRHASWLDIRATDALNLIAVIRVGQNRLDDAMRAQRRAVARQPEQPRQYVLLSNILDKMGRTNEAHAALAEVSRLRSLADSSKVPN